MKTIDNKTGLATSFLLGTLLLGSSARAQELFTKPAWLTDLSLGVSEGYDDNLLGVSGNGLQPKGSWFTTVSPKIAFNLAPLTGPQSPFQSLSLSYAPDLVTYHADPAENYDAHRVGGEIKGATGAFSFSANDSFLYNDGSRIAPTYALNQLSGAAGNQFDKYRNQFANNFPRERRDQIQDREATRLQYDIGPAFVRASSDLILYNLDTYWHNTGKAPYLGYQNYVDRSDVKGGTDFGYNIVTNVALTVGYRYGSQYQQRFPSTISSDSHYSSGTYQQALFGAEGKPFRWFDAYITAGPDFRNYNPNAPVPDLHPVRYYGKAGFLVTLSTNQDITFAYKNWSWVSSSGNVPEMDSSYIVTYHWKAASRLDLVLAAEILNVDYTIGDDHLGTAPSYRIDRMYELSPGLNFAITPHLSASLNYTFDAGNNALSSIPASSHPAYKEFTRDLVMLGLNYKF